MGKTGPRGRTERIFLLSHKKLTATICLLISGFAGINYEVLLFRKLTVIFGDHLSIQVGIVSGFLIGLALGARFFIRKSIHSSKVEFLTGVAALFALAVIFWVKSYGLAIEPFFFPLFVLLTVFPIGFFIGMAIPAYECINDIKENENSVLARVIGLYNLGAALSIVITDSFLLRLFDQESVFLFFVFINFLTSFLLRKLPSSFEFKSRQFTLPKIPIFTLFALGLVSGIFQIQLTKICFELFSQPREIFAVILSSALFGMFFSYQFRIYSWKRNSYLLLGALSLLFPYIIFPQIKPLAEQSVGIFYALGFMISIPFFLFSGAAIPWAKKQFKHLGSSGDLFFINTIGVGAGALIFNYFLYDHFNDFTRILIYLFLIFLVYVVTSSHRKKETLFAAFCFIPFVLIAQSVATTKNLYGHHLKTDGEVSFLRSQGSYVGIQTKAKQIDYFYDGHSSHHLTDRNGDLNHHLLSMATIPLHFTSNPENLLVIGGGLGIIPNIFSLYSENVTNVELSKPMISWSEKDLIKNRIGFGALGYKNVHQDGRQFLTASKNKYNLIFMATSSIRYSPSSKLTTIEFYQLAKKKLAKNGIFASLLEERSKDYNRVILKTLKSVFPYCALAFVDSFYWLSLCSEEKLETNDFSPQKDHQKMLSHLPLFYLKDEYTWQDTFSYLLLTKNLRFSKQLDDEGIPVHRDNFPVAEYLYRLPGRSTWTNALVKKFDELERLSCDRVKKKQLNILCEQTRRKRGLNAK